MSDPAALRELIGRRIRTWRRRRGLPQVELARMAGVTQSSLSNYENGKRDISVWVLVRLAEELDVSLEELTGYTRPASRHATGGGRPAGGDGHPDRDTTRSA